MPGGLMKITKIASAIMAVGLLAAAFQNCGQKTSFSAKTAASSALPTPAGGVPQSGGACKAFPEPSPGQAQYAVDQCLELQEPRPDEIPAVELEKTTFAAGEEIELRLKYRGGTAALFPQDKLWIIGWYGPVQAFTEVPRSGSGESCARLTLPPGSYFVRVLYGEPQEYGYLPCSTLGDLEFTVQ